MKKEDYVNIINENRDKIGMWDVMLGQNTKQSG